MHATVRRYEGVDTSRTDELTKKVNENLIPKLEQAARFRRVLPDRGRQRRYDLGQPLRYVGACRRVDWRRIQLGARREAGERASEFAEDHHRRSDCAEQDERSRSGIRPRLDAQEGPPTRALCSASGI